jgi:hypothetical protein
MDLSFFISTPAILKLRAAVGAQPALFGWHSGNRHQTAGGAIAAVSTGRDEQLPGC